MARIAWSKYYRPTSVKDFIFQDSATEALVKKFIEEENIPDLLLSGHHGTGKSSLANVIKHELDVDDMDWLQINAAMETSIDTIRTKVLGFVNTYAMKDFKVVYLDEADRLSVNAQDSLKSLIEEFQDNARFILTCNKRGRIIPPLHSRCQEIRFKSLDRDQLTLRAVKILKKEKVKVDDAALDILDKYIDATYPDFRKLLNVVQQKTIDGILTDGDVDSASVTEANFLLLEMMNAGQWGKMRKHISENTKEDQWEEVYRFLYMYIGDCTPFSDSTKQDEAIITIADHLYKNNFMADPEINFAACAIKLERIAKRK
jgi:replication factor C small subunit